MKLTRNWAFFFAAMAIFNEVLRATVSFDTWLFVKVWGVTALTFLFGAANVPMLLRHGLTLEAPADAPPPAPEAEG
jgi:intracellular septation protein